MIMDRAPHYKRPFENLEAEIINHALNCYNDFSKYSRSFKYFFRYLELIEWRLKKEINFYKQIYCESENAVSYEENIEVGKKLFWIIELIHLDMESLYLFAKILFDRLPYILMPLEYLVVKKGPREPKKKNFHNYIKWFNRNKEWILDSNYIKLLNTIDNFYVKDIKDPRDDIIVHQKYSSFLHGIDKEGTVIRSNNEDIHKFNNATSLMHKIINNLDALDIYFCEKLRSNIHKT